MEKKKIKINQTEMIAKKDHVIRQNEILIKIKKGDNLGDIDIPKRFFETLKTEQII